MRRIQIDINKILVWVLVPVFFLIFPEQRADYLVLHYWDNYDFTDTTCIGSPEKTEQMLSDYITILSYADNQMAEASVFELLSSVENEKNMFLFFAELLEEYLYDSNSPFRDEEYYLHVLRFIEESPALSDMEKEHFTYQLKTIKPER